MSVRCGPLDKIDDASIVDPVTHCILVQIPSGDRRREVIKAGMQERQVHDEVDRKPVACFGGCEPLAFEQDIGSGYILSKPIAEHEADVGLCHVFEKLDRDSDAYAVTLRHSADSITFHTKYADAQNLRFSIAVSMIHVGQSRNKSRNARKRIDRDVELRRTGN